MCIKNTQRIRVGFLVQALSTTSNLTAHDDAANAFIAAGGAEHLVSILTEGTSSRPIADVYRIPGPGLRLAYGAAHTLCNLAPRHASVLFVSGALKPACDMLARAARLGGSRGAHLAEPLCWTLDILAKQSEFHVAIISAGGKSALKATLEFKKVKGATAAGIAARARDLLKVLQAGKRDFKPALISSKRVHGGKGHRGATNEGRD